MVDKNIDYLLNEYKIYNYITDKTDEKFINNFLFINKIKDKKEISHSDKNYIYDNCYPNYIYSTDTTNIKINNSTIGDFSNLNNIIDNIDKKNNVTTSFIRNNNIIDLTYVKKMINNIDWNKNIINMKYSDIKEKYIDSILLTENSMNLVTLTYLQPDIILDKDVNRLSNKKKYFLEKYSDEVTTLTINKPLVGENILNIDLCFDYNGNSCPVYGSSYVYKRIKYTPNYTGQYKIKLIEYSDFENNEYSESNNQYGTNTVIAVYPDSSINSPVSGSNNGNTFEYSEQFYLTKNIEIIINVSYLKSSIDNGNLNPYSNIELSLYNDTEFLYLSNAEYKFINNNNEIDSYVYLGNTYDITSIVDKMSVNILNIKTHLILFNTKNSIFTENELYAINKYCNIEFTYKNSINPLITKKVIKSIEMKSKE